MLVAFATNFTVFCHCEARAAAPNCPCCEKKLPKQNRHKDCTGMQAMHFNLLEKQVAPQTQLKQLQMTAAAVEVPVAGKSPLPAGHTPIPAQWLDKHSPPDFHAFYQCFLI